MEKKFKLPKLFAEKWLEALRSGLYKQGKGELVEEALDRPEVLTLENCSFCCLGVAGSVCDIPFEDMYGLPYFESKEEFSEVPEILVHDDEFDVVRTLSTLNDNTYPSISEIIGRGWILRPELLESIGQKTRKLTFVEIADIIEDNFEFVEEVIEALEVQEN